MTEMRYVERCLDRVTEDSVDIKEVINVFIVSTRYQKVVPLNFALARF